MPPIPFTLENQDPIHRERGLEWWTSPESWVETATNTPLHQGVVETWSHRNQLSFYPNAADSMQTSLFPTYSVQRPRISYTNHTPRVW